MNNSAKFERAGLVIESYHKMSTLDAFHSYFPPRAPTIALSANDLPSHSGNSSKKIVSLSKLTSSSPQFCWIGIRLKDKRTETSYATDRENTYNHTQHLNNAKSICFLQQGNNHLDLGYTAILLPDNIWLPFYYPLSSTFVKIMNIGLEIVLPEGQADNYSIEMFGQEFNDVNSAYYPTIFLNKENRVHRIFRPNAYPAEQLTSVSWYRSPYLSFQKGVKIMPSLWRYLNTNYTSWSDKSIAIQCEIDDTQPFNYFGLPEGENENENEMWNEDDEVTTAV